jgi:eukaryotic-like serine/threonine-protein kinase
VSESWKDSWERDPGRPLRGGQGFSFIASALDQSGKKGFVKTLKLDRTRDRRARERFHREALTYESFDDDGIPRLFEHNADRWRDRSVPLYMVLEYIPGTELGAFITRHGPREPGSALICVSDIAATLQRCHERGYLHRDIKPANVVLRDGDITRPVLVDFGLSFNDADDDDLTRMNEEVGNRFLRLPEHQFNVRAPVSDVTQLAGVFFYLVTGIEPQALNDHSGHKPHQRSDARARLAALFTERQLFRVLSVFDRAFTQQISDRYPTPYDLSQALQTAMEPDQDSSAGDFDALMAEVDEIALTQEHAVARGLRETLTRLLRRVERIAMDFAEAKHLECTRSSWMVAADGQQASYYISVHPHNVPPTRDQLIRYDIEPRGASEFAALVDGEEVWRGESEADQRLTRAITMAVMKHFLNQQR